MSNGRVDFHAFEAELRGRANTWTQSATFARESPEVIAVYSEHGTRSFRTLHDNANRLANALRARGLKTGDAIALMCRNRPEFLETFLAAMRAGLRLTPLNTHLSACEVDYILHDCKAKMFLCEAALADARVVKPSASSQTLPVPMILIDGGVVAGCETYQTVIENADPGDLADPIIGSLMLYTSGTTGKPKGVFRDTPEVIAPQFAGSYAEYDTRQDVALCCGPAYHSAPLLFDLRWPLASGVPIVMLDKWDSEQVLELIERHRVTHAHMVATMFQRLLSLEPARRASRDLSSLRFLVHGAAPCPVQVKRTMIDWLGPILIEYYGATEGGDGIHVKSPEWLTKPGTVGRIPPDIGHAILDEQGVEVAPGTVGKIYFKAPQTGRFEYFGDPEKTAAAYQGDRFTLGDMGYVDTDGYLFLTGRIAECIISGGVNIYPQEIDDVLLSHPAVADACTVGVPDDEWGEKVVSLVVLADPHSASDACVEVLMSFLSTQLAAFKRPKQILFEAELPRSATGKLLRQKVRERFWQASNRSI